MLLKNIFGAILEHPMYKMWLVLGLKYRVSQVSSVQNCKAKQRNPENEFFSARYCYIHFTDSHM